MQPLLNRSLVHDDAATSRVSTDFTKVVLEQTLVVLV